jgi:hypothetical protein
MFSFGGKNGQQAGKLQQAVKTEGQDTALSFKPGTNYNEMYDCQNL